MMFQGGWGLSILKNREEFEIGSQKSSNVPEKTGKKGWGLLAGWNINPCDVH